MFEDFSEPVDAAGWESIPAEVLAGIGDWGFGDEDGADDPARFDRRVVAAAADAVGWHTLAVLADVPVAELSVAARSVALQQLEKLSRHVDSLKAEVIGVIAGPKPVINPHGRVDDYAANEVAVATVCSVYTADRWVWTSRDLARRLPAAAAALRRGDLSWAQAIALSEATGTLPLDIARDVESKVLRFSYRQDTRKFKAALHRWVAVKDPDFSNKARDTRQHAEVTHTPHDDGTGSLYIRGPLEATTALSMALRAYATKTKDTLGGTAAQRMVAALRDWAENVLASPGVPLAHGRAPTVNIVTDLPALLGMTNTPAYIPGIGPIPAEAARWAAADGGELRRLITDPLTGHLLDYGASTYTASPGLADYLIARNITSAGPHSSVDARECDIEHNTPHHHRGGETTRINCTPIDRRWHRPKTHASWTYTKHTDGTITWTSPTGLTCQIDPYDYRTTD